MMSRRRRMSAAAPRPAPVLARKGDGRRSRVAEQECSWKTRHGSQPGWAVVLAVLGRSLRVRAQDWWTGPEGRFGEGVDTKPLLGPLGFPILGGELS